MGSTLGPAAPMRRASSIRDCSCGTCADSSGPEGSAWLTASSSSKFPRQPVARRRYWMVATLEDVDVCLVDPGFAVDIVVRADLAALTKVWMGDSCFVDEMRSNRIEATGPRSLVRCLPNGWASTRCWRR